MVLVFKALRLHVTTMGNFKSRPHYEVLVYAVRRSNTRDGATSQHDGQGEQVELLLERDGRKLQLPSRRVSDGGHRSRTATIAQRNDDPLDVADGFCSNTDAIEEWSTERTIGDRFQYTRHNDIHDGPASRVFEPVLCVVTEANGASGGFEWVALTEYTDRVSTEMAAENPNSAVSLIPWHLNNLNMQP